MQHNVVEGEPGIFPDPVARLFRAIGGIFSRKRAPAPTPTPEQESPPSTGQVPAPESPPSSSPDEKPS